MRSYTDKVVKRHLPRTDLSREERRRLERNAKKSQAVYTLTAAQIEKIKKDATMEATKKSRSKIYIAEHGIRQLGKNQHV